MYRNVAITHWELSTNVTHSLSTVSDDIVLSDSIDEYYDDWLKPKNIEIFEKHGNVLITERGYYGAFYDDELENVTN